VGRIVVSEFLTLDGVMEDPGGSEGLERGGWAFRFERGPEGDKFKLDETLDAEALLLGRRTYDGFAAAWPSRTDEAGFADKMNSMPKFVVSSTLRDPEWANTTVVTADDLERLRQDTDGTLLVAGSAQLVNALTERGLVGELRLMVFPVVLGTGKRLFRDGLPQRGFDVVETRKTGEVVIVVLRPKPDG
jgi:dihydrofolate reductase